jgi:hypothetical protein
MTTVAVPVPSNDLIDNKGYGAARTAPDRP